MSEGNRSRSRLLPSLLGLLILLSGLALLAGGIKLASLGGSLYYLLAGIGLALSGLLLLLGKRAALGLYALVLFASTVMGSVGSRPGLVATGAAPGSVVRLRPAALATLVPPPAAGRRSGAAGHRGAGRGGGPGRRRRGGQPVHQSGADRRSHRPRQRHDQHRPGDAGRRLAGLRAHRVRRPLLAVEADHPGQRRPARGSLAHPYRRPADRRRSARTDQREHPAEGQRHALRLHRAQQGAGPRRTPARKSGASIRRSRAR